jgi:transporter family-2 protein
VSGAAVGLAILAGLAGSVQIAVMSQFGDRVGITAALAFATMLTAVFAGAVLLVTRHGLGGYAEAARQPAWLWIGSLMGLLIVGTITYSGSRIGTAATIGILIAGQLAMGAAIDRWGLFGSEQIDLSWPRLLGIALLAVGAALSLKK